MDRVLDHDLVADNLSDLFALRRKEKPDRVFLRFDDTVLTYAQMGAQVDRVRGALRRDGVRPGDRVAVLLHNSVAHVAILLACAAEGAVWSPINVGLVRADLRYTLDDLEPVLAFVGRDLAEVYDEAAAGDVPVVHVEEGESGLNHWLSEATLEPAPRLEPGAPLAVIYSGGTTGLPKGILVPRFAPIASALRMSEMARFERDDRFFTALQFYHAWTPLTVLPFCMYFGYDFCFWRWWSASRFREYVRKYEATIVDPYVGMVATLLRTPSQDDDRELPARLSIAGLGGVDALAMDLRRRFEEQFNIDTLQMYALTETGSLACVERQGETRRFGSCGKTRGWYQIIIADEEGLEVPRGTVGEILVRPLVPNSMACGYHNKWNETIKTWRDLWVHTGDLGRYDDDYLYFVGRMGHFVRRRAELVSVTEVERVVSLYPGVVEAAVVAVPSDLGEDDIKACVVIDDDDFEPADLLRFCERQIAYFKVPRYVERLDLLPRSKAKHEIERFRLAATGTEHAWDREQHDPRTRRARAGRS